MAKTSGRFSRFPAVNRDVVTDEEPAPVEDAPVVEVEPEVALAPKKPRKKPAAKKAPAVDNG